MASPNLNGTEPGFGETTLKQAEPGEGNFLRSFVRGEQQMVCLPPRAFRSDFDHPDDRSDLPSYGRNCVGTWGGFLRIWQPEMG